MRRSTLFAMVMGSVLGLLVFFNIALYTNPQIARYNLFIIAAAYGGEVVGICVEEILHKGPHVWPWQWRWFDQ
jgi:hypothetical protein